MTKEDLLIVFTTVYMVKILLHLLHLYSKTYKWENEYNFRSLFFNKWLPVFAIKLFLSGILFFVFKTDYRWLTIMINVLVGVAYLILIKVLLLP